MLRLSVIVPIYNVKPYLEKCLGSILNQCLPEDDYEAILVDDGSTDGSESIADEYASGHSNFKVFHQKNSGLSCARNAGLDLASGKYVQFVDSDDYLEPNVLRSLLDKVERDSLDVLRFDYRNVNEAYQEYQPYKDVKPFVDYRDEICTGETFLNERLGMACYAVQFLIRRALLNNCRFTPGIYFEDAEWTPRMLIKAERVSSVGTIAYNYLLRSGSITMSEDKQKQRKVLEDKFLLIDSLQKQAMGVRDARWFEGMIAHTAKQILEDVSIRFFKERKVYIQRLESMDIFPLSLYHSTARTSKKIKLINISPYLFCRVIRFNS